MHHRESCGVSRNKAGGGWRRQPAKLSEIVAMEGGAKWHQWHGGAWLNNG